MITRMGMGWRNKLAAGMTALVLAGTVILTPAATAADETGVPAETAGTETAEGLAGTETTEAAEGLAGTGTQEAPGEDGAPEEAQSGDTAPEEAAAGVETYGLRFAGSYRDVYDALLSAQQRYYWYDDGLDYAMEDTADMAAVSNAVGTAGAARKSAAAPAADAGGGAEDFSTTNLRDSNVDEADIVKTDGSYIYVLKENRCLLIAKADGPDTAWISETDLLGDDADSYDRTLMARDMYVDSDRLVVIFSKNEASGDDLDYVWTDHTGASTYDISDPERVVLLGSVWQEGSYKQSRKTGDKVYLYSTRYRNVYNRTYEECKKYLAPKVNGRELEAGDICIPEYVTDSAYLLVSSLSVKEPDRVIDSKAMVSGAENIYVTTGSLYVMNQAYISDQNRTEIVKFAFDGEGAIRGVAAARVRGYINDTFSIDEYDGNLRVLTTYMGSETGAFLEALSDIFGLGYYADDHWTRHNALYILDENLRRRARLSDIARNEEIRSARYFGDTVYFVTFRNTDPLFTADLSDPDHPKLTGELKVSGFSAYLHPYGDGLLLGIGYEADEDTGRTTGLKLSMFDVSDPANVRELDRFVMDGITWCPAIEDYKAILADGGKNLIGFYCEDRYMVFNYAMESGFERILLYDFYEDMLSGRSSSDTMRGLYIGDELYLAGESYIVGFDLAAPDGPEKNLVLRSLENTGES